MLPLAIIFVAALVFLASAIRIVPENERLAVFRLGRFWRVLGPGVTLLLPVIDRGVRVRLPERLPEWRGLSEAEIRNRVRHLVLEET